MHCQYQRKLFIYSGSGLVGVIQIQQQIFGCRTTFRDSSTVYDVAFDPDGVLGKEGRNDYGSRLGCRRRRTVATPTAAADKQLREQRACCAAQIAG